MPERGQQRPDFASRAATTGTAANWQPGVGSRSRPQLGHSDGHAWSAGVLSVCHHCDGTLALLSLTSYKEILWEMGRRPAAAHTAGTEQLP